MNANLVLDNKVVKQWRKTFWRQPLASWNVLMDKHTYTHLYTHPSAQKLTYTEIGCDFYEILIVFLCISYVNLQGSVNHIKQFLKLYLTFWWWLIFSVLHFYCKRDLVKIFFPAPMSDIWKTITVLCVSSVVNKQGEGIMNLKYSLLHINEKNISNNGRKDTENHSGKTWSSKKLRSWCGQQKGPCKVPRKWSCLGDQIMKGLWTMLTVVKMS